MATKEKIDFIISVVDKASAKFKRIKESINSTSSSVDHKIGRASCRERV